MSDDVLLTLVRALAQPLGADLTAADEQARGFTLTVTHLSLLYRHARLAERLGLQARDLFRLIRHAGLPGGFVENADQVATLLDVHEWWRTSGWSLDDLEVMARRAPRDAAPVLVPADVVDALLDAVRDEQALTFTDTVFAFLPDVTEDDSRALVAANGTRILDAGGGRKRLATAFDRSIALTVPARVTVDEPAARGLLGAFHPAEVLPARLAGTLGAPAEVVATLLEILGADLSSGALPAALHGEQGPDALVGLVADLVPLLVLFRAPAFDAATIGFVRDHRDVFSLADPRALTPETQRAVSAFAALVTASEDAEPEADALERRGADVRSVLAAFTVGAGLGAADLEPLARVLQSDPGAVARLRRAVYRRASRCSRSSGWPPPRRSDASSASAPTCWR